MKLGEAFVIFVVARRCYLAAVADCDRADNGIFERAEAVRLNKQREGLRVGDFARSISELTAYKLALLCQNGRGLARGLEALARILLECLE